MSAFLHFGCPKKCSTGCVGYSCCARLLYAGSEVSSDFFLVDNLRLSSVLATSCLFFFGVFCFPPGYAASSSTDRLCCLLFLVFTVQNPSCRILLLLDIIRGSALFLINQMIVSGKKKRESWSSFFTYTHSLCLVTFWGTVELVHSADQCLKLLIIDLFSLLLETERDPNFLVVVMHWKDFLFFQSFMKIFFIFSNVGHTLSSHLEIKLLSCKGRLQLMSVWGNRSAHFLSISARLPSCILQQMLLTQQIFLLCSE